MSDNGCNILEITSADGDDPGDEEPAGVQVSQMRTYTTQPQNGRKTLLESQCRIYHSSLPEELRIKIPDVCNVM
jgi:hypothetical protein